MDINEQISEIRRLTSEVRDHINTDRHQTALLENLETWNQICSSLDVIEDTLWAIESYWKKDFPKEIGLRYIYTYGFLQALYVMQDALRDLAEAFDLPFELTATLGQIRELRNASIGHPTKQGRKRPFSYNFFSQISMSKDGFDLMRCSAGEDAIEHVVLSKVCSDQLEEVFKAYRSIAEKLEDADRSHKEKFMDQSLSDILRSTMGHYFEKISEAIHSQPYRDTGFGKTHVALAFGVYENLKLALIERDELNEFVEFDIDGCLHALAKLDQYFAGENSSMEAADARIYVSYLRYKHKDLVSIANEIDEEYKIRT